MESFTAWMQHEPSLADAAPFDALLYKALRDEQA